MRRASIANKSERLRRNRRLGGHMDYPRIYNAASDMVDRNVALGRATKTVFIDPSETLTYGELQARTNRMANLCSTYGIPRESRVALLLARYRRFSGCVLGRHQGRRGAGVPQHAADGGAVRLHPRRQPRQGAVRFCAAAAGRAADTGSSPVPQARVRVGRRTAQLSRSRCAENWVSSRPRHSSPTPARTKRHSGSTRRGRQACPKACAMCIRARWKRPG